MIPEMIPTTPLNDGESVLHSFLPDRGAYWRDHAWMAAGAMALGMTILWAIGNPDVWTGAVGGLAAVAVRAFYLASDELKARWDLTETRLLGPQGRNLRLAEIKHIRTQGSAVQLITHSGDKHMLKFQANRDDTIARIERAQIGGWS
ncbi:hypothetical protein [Thalassovita sp.]|uniref:hypothetical protein n=1 Tax=Thalassovita sp. TaxID=1979401 RepID=UPI002B26C27C|nr:hypothetical protein [Thalassovita sp.]